MTQVYRLLFWRSCWRRLRTFVIKFFFLDVVRDVEIPRGFGKGQLDIDHFRENARSTLDLRTREVILREAQYGYLTGCYPIHSWPGIHLTLLSSPEPSFVPLGGWGEAKTRRVSDDGRKKKEQKRGHFSNHSLSSAFYYYYYYYYYYLLLLLLLRNYVINMSRARDKEKIPDGN